MISCTAVAGVPKMQHGPTEIGRCGSRWIIASASIRNEKSRLMSESPALSESSMPSSAPHLVASGWARSRSDGTATSSGRVSICTVEPPGGPIETRKAEVQSGFGTNVKPSDGNRWLTNRVCAGVQPETRDSVPVSVTVPSGPTSVTTSSTSIASAAWAASPVPVVLGGNEVSISDTGHEIIAKRSVNLMASPASCWGR